MTLSARTSKFGGTGRSANQEKTPDLIFQLQKQKSLDLDCHPEVGLASQNLYVKFFNRETVG
jgi:hypothetical protein